MATVKLNKVTLAYEILGEGPPVVLTPWGTYGEKELVRPAAEYLSTRNQVLIYDRRNCGESELALRGNKAEIELFADDLHFHRR